LAHGPRRSGQARAAATEFLIVDGGAGLESAIAAVWDSVPVPAKLAVASGRYFMREVVNGLMYKLVTSPPWY
jgi:hypothetical protein